MKFKTTKEIKVSPKISEQVIGQDNALRLVKKAAKQRRNIILIGESGTGKSLLGQALAELLPSEKLKDILAYPNPADENVPIIKTMPRGEGKKTITKLKLQTMSSLRNMQFMLLILAFIVALLPYYFYKNKVFPFDEPVVFASSMITGMVFIVGIMLFLNLNKRMSMRRRNVEVPKLLVDNSKKKKTPFIDGTGAHAGALLGDVLHDPLQSFSGNNLILKSQSKSKKVRISTEVNRLLEKHKKDLIRKKGYTATYLKKGELKILAEKNNKIKPIQVLSVNKYKSNKPYLYKITTESGKTLLITPEHKVAVNKKGKKQWTEASKLKRGKEVFIFSFVY